MLIPSYIRRAAEIEIALLVDYVNIQQRNIQKTKDFFINFLNVLYLKEDEPLILTLIVNYKKFMPTAEELALVSDFAPSRSAFIRAEIIKNKISRKTMYEKRREAGDLTLKLQPKLKTMLSDAAIRFLDKFEPLVQALAQISLNCYNFED